METRHHCHEETFPVSPERLFSLLHTPSAVQQWWGASTVIVIPESNGMWCASWGEDQDRPEYVSAADISVFDPPHRMVLTNNKYSARDGGLPFDADFEVEFVVSRHTEGAKLQVCQRGFPCRPEADEYFTACIAGWKATFEGIRSFLQ